MADSLSTSITFETHDDVAVIRMDDGKANAFGHDAIDGVNAGLERAEAEAKAVVLVGREGKFSAGFDLSIMAGDDRDARVALLGDGARLCHRLYMHPQPVVAAVTGHALALGALVLASCDLRIGADGPFKIGTNEVAIGMALPRFGVEVARDRLSKRHFTAAEQWARIYDPAGAAEAGWLDTVVAADQVEATALEAAAGAGATLHRGGVAAARSNARSAVAAAMLEGLEIDLAELR